MSEHGPATGDRHATASTGQDQERAIEADGSVVNGDGGFGGMCKPDETHESDGVNEVDRIHEGNEDTLAERVDAIERAITGDVAATDLSDRAAMDARITELEATIESMDRRLEELDAATQAVRGYVGGVRAVNREVERRADLALAKASRLERDRPATGRSADHDRDPPNDAGSDEPIAEVTEDDAPWRADDGAGTVDGRNDHTGTVDGMDGPTTGPGNRSAARRADGGALRTDRPPAAAAAVPNADEIGRIPDAATDHAGSASDRPDAGVLAKLRDVL
ncbi:DUF7310 family coiled-coil domain-containing protein [Halopenitus persicus]|uniref:DUF7310 family coiled-coil domain-containing protein n=1 Tax=Halopenitus persicus TaxID=1048396 RepID=UPI000BBB5E22|nr:hypothetical protein [Halopenitus persicus]